MKMMMNPYEHFQNKYKCIYILEIFYNSWNWFTENGPKNWKNFRAKKLVNEINEINFTKFYLGYFFFHFLKRIFVQILNKLIFDTIHIISRVFWPKFSGPLWIVLNFLTWGPFFGRRGTAIYTTHFGSGVGPLGGQKGGNVIWFILGCEPQFVPVYWMNPSPNICGWCRLKWCEVAWVKLRYFAFSYVQKN